VKLLVFFVRAYQKTISPQTGVLRFIYSSPVFCLFPNIKAGCKNYPRCSDYLLESVDKLGFISGIKKTIIRIINCR
jgi:putative component of membrane protein insertase Oxa1/YidC/SpoIIIJ protein YidD